MNFPTEWKNNPYVPNHQPDTISVSHLLGMPLGGETHRNHRILTILTMDISWDFGSSLEMMLRHASIDWFKGKFTGKSYISWEKLWISRRFSLQLIHWIECWIQGQPNQQLIHLLRSCKRVDQEMSKENVHHVCHDVEGLGSKPIYYKHL